MLTIKQKGLLLYIVDHCKRIETKTEGLVYEEFLENEDAQDVICFNMLQIGELAGKFDDEFIKKHKDAPWIAIRGMRNRIVHAYGTIQKDKVWATAIQDIEELRNYCEQILNENK